MKKKIIDLEIIDDLAQSGVAEIALVDIPAIEKYWMAFRDEEFLDKNPCWEGYEPYGLKDNGAPNCIPIKNSELGPYTDEEFADSYDDYPEAAKNNAQRALDWAEENGWGDCGTPIGKARANQLAKGEPISEETIARMASFERHRQNSETPYGSGCGGIMWDAWGGAAGVEWASKKLETLREELSYDTGGLQPYVDQVGNRKEKMAAEEYPTLEEAQARSRELGLDGEIHSHATADGFIYMPGASHADLVKALAELELAFAERPISRIPKAERGREGSAKNKPGDTKTSRGGIEVSEQVEGTLRDKIKEHNEKNPQDSQKADMGMLKAVWRRGAGAYSVGTPGRRSMTRPQWSMGRVNAFLKILSGSAPTNPKYTQDNDLLPKSHPRHSKGKKEDMSLALAYFRSLDGLHEQDLFGNGMRFDADTEGMDLQFAAGFTVYRYEGSVGSDTRDFCREMVGDGRFFTFAEITGFNSSNPGFGPGGSDEYSIFNYKGGANCKHRWQKYYVNPEGKRENKGPAPGKAGTKPFDMPNQGYMMSKLLFAAEDQQIVVGPVAIPDMEIQRVDPDTKEKYFVKFSKEVVARMAEKFFKELRNQETNIQHNSEDRAGSYVFQSWIVENMEDKANTVYGLNVPVGSWVVAMRVEDPATWKRIKAGELRGFSLEGSFLDKKDFDQYQKDREIYNKVMKILKKSE